MVKDRPARAALVVSALIALGGTATLGQTGAPTEAQAHKTAQAPTEAQAHPTAQARTTAQAQAPTQAPGVTPSVPAPTLDQVAVAVVGTSTLVGQASPGTAELEGAIVHVRGNQLITLEETSDPRTSGRALITVNFDAFPDSNGLPGATQVRYGHIRIENEGGAWQGHFTGSLANAGFLQLYWLEGEGGYEGLSYVVTAGGNGNVWQSSGLIFPGSVPRVGTSPSLPIDAIGGERPTATSPRK